MIRSFADKEAIHIWNGKPSLKLPNEIQETARRKLRMLNSAQDLLDLKIPPSNKLEKLKGDLKGLFSIRINRQWRITFKWSAGNAYHVRIVDYHK